MIEDIKKFLVNTPGYLKEGANRLRSVLENKGYDTTELSDDDIRLAIRTVNKFVDASTINHNPTIKRLFYDIETSYNIGKFWRTGYKCVINSSDVIIPRAIICVSYKWEGEDKVHTLKWDKGDDKKLVKKFLKVMQEADELVGHNIDRYDTKFLLTRAIQHGIPALPKYYSDDTLKIAKKHFIFNDNRLNTIATQLGLGGKLNHTGMQMWDDIVLYDKLNIGNKKDYEKSFNLMVKYCEKDVMLTEEVYHKLSQYSENKVHHGVLNGNPRSSCPNCGHVGAKLIDRVSTKGGMLKALMQCTKCGKKYFISYREYLKTII